VDVKNHRCVVTFGSNLDSRFGAPNATVLAAFAAIASEQFTPVKESELYSTPAFPAGWGPDYVNAAGLYQTVLSPTEILKRLHEVEADFGRERTQRWGNRVLDIDLVAVDEVVLPDLATWQAWANLPLEEQTQKTPDELILPHPRLADRAFVLVPVLDVAPDWTHPVTGETVREMHANLPPEDLNAISRL